MRKKFSMHFVLLTFIILLGASCKKDGDYRRRNRENTSTTPTPTPTPTTPVATNPSAPSYEVGTGSGALTIDGKSLNLTTIKLITIKAGNYTSINILNVTGSAAQPISIKNNGLVNVSQSLSTSNVSYINIAGDNTAGLTYGFSFNNISYRAVVINGKVNGITLKSMSFKNVADYVISGNGANGSSLKYTGTADTRSENFKILNCSFENSGSIIFGGGLNEGDDSGLFKDVEVAYNVFSNTNAGTVCNFSNVQDYNVHHNVVDNINQSNNNHNGVFHMQGNGLFHDNKLTNYQGNAIRMWAYSRGNNPATVEIYNNVCYNTRKYGAFEIQGFARNYISGKSTYANAKVYNNTVGKMNTSKDWDGQILDLYNYEGTLEYYNNLGFELYKSGGSVSNMINNMSDTNITKESNNKYFTTQQAAVINLTSFTSLASGIGASGF